MNFVFITYPYHYHITLAAIKRVVKLYPACKIVVMFDDLHYVNKLFDFLEAFVYDAPKVEVIPFSSIDAATKVELGWNRQQLVKLNLHKVLDFDTWMCIDGDTLLQEKLSTDKWYINVHDAVCPWNHHYNFVNYALDLNYQKIKFKEHTLNSVSGMPIKNMNKTVLEGLESYVQKLHGVDILSLSNCFTLKKNVNRYFEMTEWDMIGFYEVFILKNHLPFEELNFEIIPTKQFEQPYENKIKVLDGHDNMSIEWYKSNGVEVNLTVFDALNYRRG